MKYEKDFVSIHDFERMSKAGNDLVLYSAVGLLISKKEAPLRSPQDNLDVLRHDLAWNICPEGRAGVGWLRNRSRYRKLHKGRDTSAHEETTAHDIDHFRVPPRIAEADMRRPCKRKDLSAMAVVPAWRIVHWVEDREGKRRSAPKANVLNGGGKSNATANIFFIQRHPREFSSGCLCIGMKGGRNATCCLCRKFRAPTSGIRYHR